MQKDEKDEFFVIYLFPLLKKKECMSVHYVSKPQQTCDLLDIHSSSLSPPLPPLFSPKATWGTYTWVEAQCVLRIQHSIHNKFAIASLKAI
jgi:hypothetical protein